VRPHRRRCRVVAVQESNMRRLNDFRFYELGIKLKPLEDVNKDTTYRSVFYELWFARGAVADLLKTFPELSICHQAARELMDAITVIVPDDWAAATEKDMDEKLGYHYYGIQSAKEAFEHVLSAELDSLNTYLLTQHGIYRTADLVERADMAFGETTRRNISEEARKDFRQGGRCLAFELPTASGFHTMRATEAVLRQYHRLVTRLSDEERSPEMAQCINELRKSGEDGKLMGILDSIRDLHRNPQMHPEAFLTMDEAIRLFDISKSAINAMSDRIGHLNISTNGPSGLTASFASGLAPALSQVFAAQASRIKAES
jgi:hypothetical protein